MAKPLVIAATGVLGFLALGIDERWLWPVLGAGWLAYMAWTPTPRPLATGIGGGAAAGLLAGAIHALYIGRYLAAHPTAAAALQDVPLSQARYFLLFSALATGALYGSMAGLGAWGIARMRRTRATGPPVELEAEDGEE